MSIGGPGPKTGLLIDTTLANLEIAWNERIVEAATFATAHPMMSLALRLYALEIIIKTFICKRLDLSELPTHCKTHDLTELLIFTGLQTELYEPVNDAIRKNWDHLVKFSKSQLNNLRYLPESSLSGADLKRTIDALDDPTTGVWTWLRRHP